MTLARFHIPGPLLLLALFVGCDRHHPLAPGIEAAAGGQPGPTLAAPSNTSAVAVSWSQINVAWRDNSSNETGFEVYLSTTGPSGSFGALISLGANAASYGNTGLAASTQYCYKVRAFRTTGGKTTYSAFSSAACATTPAAPVPAAASAVNAVPRFGYAFGVTWSDNSSDETGFRVERAAASTGPWTSAGTTSANVTSLADYLENYPYPGDDRPACYRVFAVSSFGDSGPSNVDCTAMPATPTNLLANPVGGTAVDLRWTDNSAVEDGFQVWRAGGGADWGAVATLPANTTGYHDAGMTPDNTYWYAVYATRDGGSSSNSEVVQVVLATTPPVAPSGLGVQPTSSTSVYGLWLDQSSNEAGFRVEHSINGGASWVTAATTGTDEYYFVEAGLSADQQACYRVIAYNSVGESPPSNTACTTPPAGPTDLTVAAVDAMTVDLAWTDNSAVEDGYEVWVDEGYGSQYSIASLGPNTTTFRTNYYYAYWVVAVKDGGYSDISNIAYPPAPPGSSIARVGASRPAPDPRIHLTPSLKRAAALRSRLAPPARRPPGSARTGGKP
jgi:titin